MNSDDVKVPGLKIPKKSYCNKYSGERKWRSNKKEYENIYVYLYESRKNDMIRGERNRG